MKPTKYMSFKEYAEYYCSKLNQKNAEYDGRNWGATLERDTIVLSRILNSKVYPSIGDIALMDIDILTNRILSADLKRLQIPHSSRCNILSIVKNILLDASKAGLVEKEVVKSFNISRKTSPHYYVYSADELDAICRAAFTVPNALIYLLSLFTGMAGKEIRALFWSDINTENRTLNIKRYIGKEKDSLNVAIKPTTDVKQRNIFLNTKAWQILSHQYSLEFQGESLKESALLPDRLIFHHKDDINRYLDNSQLSYILMILKMLSGVENIGFNNLRHNFAIITLSQTNDLIALKTNMGYEDIIPIINMDAYTTSIDNDGEEDE